MTTAGVAPDGEELDPVAAEAQLDPALVAALRRFARLDTVLVALDFDGTLAPEVDVPHEARALPQAVVHLDALQHSPGLTLAFVSGRSLASLDVVAPPTIVAAMIGSHGLELRLAPGDERSPGDKRAPGDERSSVDEVDRARVETLRTALEPLVTVVAGAWIEHKPAGFAVHTRAVDPDAATRLQRSVRAAAATVDRGLTVRDGKNVVEFAVRDATKGDGLRALRARLRPDAVLFAGDDVTDEDALAALEPGDLGIKVGPAATMAAWRVSGPAAVAAVLGVIEAERSGRPR